MKCYPIFILLYCCLAVPLSPLRAWGTEYTVEKLTPEQFEQPDVTLPDLSRYTSDAVKQKIGTAKQQKTGAISRKLMTDIFELKTISHGSKFYQVAMHQKTLPRALVIEHGVLTLQQASKLLPDYLVQQGPSTYLAKLPIVISHNATLILENDTLQLSRQHGVFIANCGDFFLQGGALLGWDEEQDTPAWYSGHSKDFRPFYVSWGGSYTYFNETEVSHLGYLNGKSYGITFTTYSQKPSNKAVLVQNDYFNQPPRGWILNSTFSDNMFGFYCYQAEDVVIKNNIYDKNIVYGIDPHDKSKNLIIAYNKTRNTKLKHGIIVSREVDDSFILYNESYKNNLSGIMLDRNSVRNIVCGNKVYDNKSNGITLFESSHNLLCDNTIFSNGIHGISVRNSTDTRITGNTILNNRYYGISLSTADLAIQEYRDLAIDPYEKKISASIRGGVISFNKSGAISANESEYLLLADAFIENAKGFEIQFGGFLQQYSYDIGQALFIERAPILLKRISVN